MNFRWGISFINELGLILLQTKANYSLDGIMVRANTLLSLFYTFSNHFYYWTYSIIGRRTRNLWAFKILYTWPPSSWIYMTTPRVLVLTFLKEFPLKTNFEGCITLFDSHQNCQKHHILTLDKSLQIVSIFIWILVCIISNHNVFNPWAL